MLTLFAASVSPPLPGLIVAAWSITLGAIVRAIHRYQGGRSDG